MKRENDDSSDEPDTGDPFARNAELVIQSAEALAPRPPADWYQDSPLVTLPKECQPNWRTIH